MGRLVCYLEKPDRFNTREEGNNVIHEYLTSEPEKIEEGYKRRAGKWFPKGVKILGQWSDLAANRTFTLWEADAESAAKFTRMWSDIGKSEVVPVMETEKYMKLTQK